jgi:hypothetical protein
LGAEILQFSHFSSNPQLYHRIMNTSKRGRNIISHPFGWRDETEIGQIALKENIIANTSQAAPRTTAGKKADRHFWQKRPFKAEKHQMAISHHVDQQTRFWPNGVLC